MTTANLTGNFQNTGLVNLLYPLFVFLLYTFIFVKAMLSEKSPRRQTTIKKISAALKSGINTLLRRTPLLVAILVVVAMIDVFVPREIIISLIGSSRGFLSVLIATILGSVLMGPVATSFPLGMILLAKGASVSSVASFLFAWVMVGITVLPFEISVFGNRFALVRNAFSFAGAIILGLLMGLLMSGRLF